MKKPNNADQEKFWSSPSGHLWIQFETQLDAAFREATDRLIGLADLKPGDKVLDVGCGTGETTIRIAQSVGKTGEVLAVDISRPLLDRARQRADVSGLKHLDFQHGDAQIFNFPPAHFDTLFSRFGVMFFSDPRKAFANLRGALRAKGRVVFAGWASVDENPWFKGPRAAAVACLGEPKPFPPRAPGPMAFAETDYVSEILRDAGYSDVTATPTTINLLPTGGLDGAANLAGNVGLASRIMREYNGTPADLEQIVSDIRAGFSLYDTPDGPKIPAVINIFTATE